MKVIYGIGRIKERFKNPVVTIGVFDGVHLGHQRLLRRVVCEAKKLDGTSIVITFHPHPSHVLSPRRELPLLISLKERLRLLRESGIAVCVVAKFSKNFSRMRAKDFVNKYLIAKLHPVGVLVGSDFVFGSDQKGDLRFELKIKRVPPKKICGRVISSTLIRNLLRKSALAKASQLLNRPLLVRGKVERGSGKGRGFGFPTANIRNFDGILMPRGAYAVRVTLAKRSYYGMAFIGRRPAFVTKDRTISLEVNIFDFKRNILGREIAVEFLKKIRAEKKIADVDSLIKQLKLDRQSAKKIIQSRKTPHR